MAVLTEHMTRLRLEIATLRGARQALLAELRRTTQLRKAEVNKLCQEFWAEIAAARQVWLGTVPGGPRAVEVQAPEGVAVEAEAIVAPEAEAIPAPTAEAIEELPRVEAEAEETEAEPEAEREEAKEAGEIPEEAAELGIKEAEPGAAPPEAWIPKKTKKKKKKH